MENRQIAQILSETADLLEVSAADSFRIRSYRRAAEVVEQSTMSLGALATEPKQLLEIPGIGKGMAANIVEMEKTGTLASAPGIAGEIQAVDAGIVATCPAWGQRRWRCFGMQRKFPASMSWKRHAKKAAWITLPRCGPKQVAKLLQGIAEYRKNIGRFHLDDAELAAEKLTEYLRQFSGH